MSAWTILCGRCSKPLHDPIERQLGCCNDDICLPRRFERPRRAVPVGDRRAIDESAQA